MTKRASLTPRERAAMLEAQNGRCLLCDDPITLRTCIAEHFLPVALGNAERPDCLLCLACANRKTWGTKATSYGSDAHAIAKDKRLRGETKQGPKKRIPSRPMPTPPEGYSTAWPSRALPSRPMTRSARNG